VSEPTELARLETGARGLGVALSADQSQRLVGYVDLLQRWNEKFNLVSRRDVGRLLSRHVLDSLSIGKWLHGTRILDIGSGAGLPGIPLAIVNTDRQWVLVDRGARKARFLEHVVMTLELGNVEVQAVDAATLTAEPPYSTIVSRAVSGLEKLWQIAEPLLQDGGRLILMNRTGMTEHQPLDRATAYSPSGARVVNEQVQIPGLAAPHEVLIVERGE
jgi:16S rRNA (guanine527-N7)-methyltransferase